MKHLIVDVDTGSDDAVALILALTRPNVEIVAVTCVTGNTDVDNVCANTLRVLDLCNKPEIPVYRGAESALLPKLENMFFFGNSGLNDVDWPRPVDTDRVQSQHAVVAMIDIVNKRPGEITLVVLGPMTNIALALRLDPELGNKLKDVYVMGGSTDGSGNVTDRGEFNFAMDPESASICLRSMQRIIHLGPMDVIENHQLPWETYDTFTALKTEKSMFMEKIYSRTVEWLRQHGYTFICFDLVAMAAVVDESVVLRTEDVHADVELHGHLTHGEMVVSRVKAHGLKPNLRVIKEFDNDKLIQMILSMLK